MNKHIPAFQLAPPRETVISRAFASLLPILAAYIRTGRDLQEIGYNLEPAYSEWHRASDAAQDQLVDVLRQLRSTPAPLAVDAPLRRMAVLIHAMRCDPENARELHRAMDIGLTTRFHVRGTGATAQNRNLLLALCRPLVEQFAALPLFDPGSGDDVDRAAPI